MNSKKRKPDAFEKWMISVELWLEPFPLKHPKDSYWLGRINQNAYTLQEYRAFIKRKVKR